MARRRGDDRDAASLNLVPVMNLVTILIPFLLMSAQFVQLATIDTTLPAICVDCVPSEEEPIGPDRPLNLKVHVLENGLRVDGTDVDQTLPCPGGSCDHAYAYDMAGLTAVLAEVKDGWPHESAVTLVVEEQVAYQVIVMAMDSSREAEGRELFPFVVVGSGL